MISVLITSESRYPLDRQAIRQAITRVLKEEGIDEVEISVLVVGGRKIRALNQEFRKIDEETDVLAFPLEEARGPDRILRLGDIVICFPAARELARLENKLVGEKMIELVEHGLKHLLGKNNHD